MTFDPQSNTLTLSPARWQASLAFMKDHRVTGLNAAGHLNDAALKQLAKLDHLTRLNLDGATRITDKGLAHLAHMPQLRELNISGWKGQITDKGIKHLAYLPQLRTFKICWQQHVTDAGLALLKHCPLLEEVNLMGTNSGDAAITALAGMPHLRQLDTGRQLTNAGIAQLHEIPCFKKWHGGKLRYGLMGAGAWPTRVMLDGPFTDLSLLKGLNGLFGLGFFWHSSRLASQSLKHLAELPKLGAVSCGETRCDDEALRHISRIPQLRMLLAQGAVATDKGFTALSKSPTLEYLWGRDFTGLTAKGFLALSKMPALLGLAVNLANVSDKALARLPEFPALRELTPMNVTDDAFRHIGQCRNLQALWCMYCRQTGDAATQHLAGLRKLKIYYAGASQITDQSLEILSKLPALMRIELWQCLRITNAGLPHVSKIREVEISGMPQLTDWPPAPA